MRVDELANAIQHLLNVVHRDGRLVVVLAMTSYSTHRTHRLQLRFSEVTMPKQGLAHLISGRIALGKAGDPQAPFSQMFLKNRLTNRASCNA